MATNFYRIKNGLTLTPQTGSTVTAEGDMAYNDSTKKVEIHDGSTVDSVVEEAKAATVSNKQIAFSSSNDSTTTGASATLQSFTSGIVRLTNGSLTSVAGIPGGSTGLQLIINNETGNQININNEDAGATAANRIRTGTGANVAMPSDSSFIFTYDATTSRWDLTGGSGSGSGTGGTKNYLSAVTTSQSATPNTGNGNFELGSTSGWSLAHSALTSNFPSTVGTAGNSFSSAGGAHGGSAASGNLSISAVSTSQLAGSYSLSYASTLATTAGDMLISDAFYIDTEDQAKVLGFKFAYQAHTNPSNGNFSGTSSNSFGVAIYDVTNAAWIMPAGVYNIVQSSGVGYATGTFQTTSNSTQYQVAFFNANASSGAITMYLDDFFVGPQVTMQAPAMSDWTSFTMTVTGTITNPTIGSQTLNKAFYRRVGDSAEISFQLEAGSGGSAGSGTYLFALPSGLSADTTKVAGAGDVPVQLGQFSAITSGTTDATVGHVTVYDSTHLAVFLDGPTQAGNYWGSGTSPTFGTNPLFIGLSAKVPIAGWSSNTVSSADTDTRVVAASFTSSETTSIGNTGTTILGSNSGSVTVNYDTHSAFNSSTGEYTVPVSGKYRVSANGNIKGANTSAPFSCYLSVLKNAVVQNSTVSSNSGTSAGNGGAGDTISVEINCNAGDKLKIQVGQYNAGGTSATLSSTDYTSNITNLLWGTFERLSGPAVVQATESVSFAGSGATSNAVGASTTVQFSTIELDTHNTWNNSGKYWVAPVSGIYHIEGHARFNFSSASVNQFIETAIQINGVTKRAEDQYLSSTGISGISAGVQYVARLKAGDQVSLVLGTNMTAPSIDTSTTDIYLQVMRVGN